MGGGISPRWRRDGKELYYRAPDGKVMVVEVATGPGFQCVAPKALFSAPPVPDTAVFRPFSFWDLTPDGNRFLLATPSKETSSAPFNVVLNWTALLKK
jgi:hypothetical protein